MKNRINLIWKVIIPVLRNKFLVTIIVFVIWISFFDTYSLIDRYSSLNELNSLKKEHEFFKEELDLYNSQFKELFSGKRELEKFAREQYLMKADNEDIYIIVNED